MKVNSPDQEKAIKKMMASIKRAASTVRRSYPKFTPGMTTERYIKLFEAYGGGTQVLPYDHAKLARPAPYIVGHEAEAFVDA